MIKYNRKKSESYKELLDMLEMQEELKYIDGNLWHDKNFIEKIPSIAIGTYLLIELYCSLSEQNRKAIYNLADRLLNIDNIVNLTSYTKPINDMNVKEMDI